MDSLLNTVAWWNPLTRPAVVQMQKYTKKTIYQKKINTQNPKTGVTNPTISH